jgi:hypothetical protein
MAHLRKWPKDMGQPNNDGLRDTKEPTKEPGSRRSPPQTDQDWTRLLTGEPGCPRAADLTLGFLTRRELLTPKREVCPTPRVGDADADPEAIEHQPDDP